ncbi:Trafficking Kinesin-Binding Protein 1 [Manis pentadactyla]|nr:Trafficking Kinesin-Binding Protein 1 [Manis pentadactyla]
MQLQGPAAKGCRANLPAREETLGPLIGDPCGAHTSSVSPPGPRPDSHTRALFPQGLPSPAYSLAHLITSGNNAEALGGCSLQKDFQAPSQRRQMIPQVRGGGSLRAVQTQSRALRFEVHRGLCRHKPATSPSRPNKREDEARPVVRPGGPGEFSICC